MGSQLDLEAILVLLTFFSGLVLLFYKIKPVKNQADGSDKDIPLLLDYSRSFFPILLIVVIVRSFIAEPFRIPSGSMIPTLEIGDFILVKKYSYGVRLPVIHKKFIETGKPERGDVAVFRYPPNPKINYIKRVIGLPGDQIEWTKDKKLIINGNPVTSKKIENFIPKDKNISITIHQFEEQLPETGKSYKVIHFPERTRSGKWTVPEGHYFVMGDNRDNSSDSRFWKFVPETHLVGKASLVWMHIDWSEGGDGFQAKRIGVKVN